MMNESRITIGFQSAASGYAGYLASLEYAEVRTQGRPVADQDPARPQIELIEHADVKRMLLAQKSYVEGALAQGLMLSSLLDVAGTTIGNRRQ